MLSFLYMQEQHFPTGHTQILGPVSVSEEQILEEGGFLEELDKKSVGPDLSQRT